MGGGPAPELEEQFVIMAAWYCDPCEVQGRSVVADGVACWNCSGPVAVTARPAIRASDLNVGSSFAST